MMHLGPTSTRCDAQDASATAAGECPDGRELRTRDPRGTAARAPRGIIGWTIAAAGFLALIAGPRFASANDLSDSPCTAGDVEIVGSGFVVNEPCTCSPGGTFNATVRFTVRNNTSTGRYCVALHLV